MGSKDVGEEVNSLFQRQGVVRVLVCSVMKRPPSKRLDATPVFCATYSCAHPSRSECLKFVWHLFRFMTQRVDGVPKWSDSKGQLSLFLASRLFEQKDAHLIYNCEGSIRAIIAFGPV